MAQRQAQAQIQAQTHAQTQAELQTGASATLNAIRARGELRCGIAGTVAGFSLADSQGVMRGLDADICRALAAAVLGDANRVKFVPTTTENRFTALQSGEVDVLSRQASWTLGREASLGLLFGPVDYYDGTGFLVKTASHVASAKALDGATICVQPGTSTELAVADYFRQNSLRFTPVEINDLQQIESAFTSGRCDAFSTDSSFLAAFRHIQGTRAADFTLLPDIISKEPLAPAVRKGDDKWFDVVRWTLYAMITAEEDGVTSQNIGSFANAGNPEIRRLLGQSGGLGQTLGLNDRFAYNIIRQVGNYGEVWDRSFGAMGVPRGLNRLWNAGGLQYAPPLR